MSDVIQRINEATARLSAASAAREEHLAQANALEEQARAERRKAHERKVECAQLDTVLKSLGVQRVVEDHAAAAAKDRAAAADVLAQTKKQLAETERIKADHEKLKAETDERLQKAESMVAALTAKSEASPE